MAKHKVVRQKVVAFRLTAEQYAAFAKRLIDQPVVGAKSPGLMARKMALDYTLGELSWKNRKRQLTSPELYKNAKALSAAAA